MGHLPPIPAGFVIAAVAVVLVFANVVGRMKRRLRRQMGRQLRQAFVAGFAAGTAGGWTMGRRFMPPTPRLPTDPYPRAAA